jgi:DNA-binding XRE family transcriptional regulator
MSGTAIPPILEWSDLDLAIAGWLRLSLADGTAERLRLAAGLRKVDVALEAGVTRQTYRAWCEGDSVPTPDQALRLGRVLKDIESVVLESAAAAR